MSSSQPLILTGLRCPLPVLRVKKALATLASQEHLEIIVDDPSAPEDIAAFCRQTGHKLIHSKPTPPHHRLTIQKK